jgi:PhoH-like ATPase
VTTRRTTAGAEQTPAETATTRRAPRGRRAVSTAADPGEPRPSGQAFVLDTSVLLSDPAAFHRFAEHEVLPLVVISELEGKRHHPELGWFARQSLRMLDELRVAHGRLDRPVPANDLGGTLRVELNHTDDGVLPPGFRNESNDARILSVALNLAAEGRQVTLVSKDMPLRVKAASVGLAADVPARPGQRPDLDRHVRTGTG